MASQRNQKNHRNKKQRKHKETSKIITGVCILIVVSFLLYACYEIHRVEELSAVEYIADIIKWLATVSIGGYFIKARTENQMKLQIEYQKQASELKKKYKDDFVEEVIVDDLSQ